jgi:hypothetical protein
MSNQSHVREWPRRKHPRWLKALPKFRMKVLVAGVLGGGTMIAFPAATAIVVTYMAAAIAAVGVMAWAGMVAFASLAAAILIVPVVIVLAIFGINASVGWIVRILSGRRGLDNAALGQQLGGNGSSDALAESLAKWETDGGRAGPPQSQSTRPLTRSSDRRRRAFTKRKALAC